MAFTWEYSDGIVPKYGAASGSLFGFIGGAEYAADPALQVPETGNGFVPMWWYGSELPVEPLATKYGVQAAPSKALRKEDAGGRLLPLRFRAAAAKEGAYRAHVTLCGTGGEALLFTGRRHLAWHGTLGEGEQIKLTTLCDLFPIIPRGTTKAASCTSVEITVAGHAALRKVSIEGAPEARRVWVLGDSTVTDQSADVPYAPGTSYAGWGQMLPLFLPDGFCVTNHSHSGLTTESLKSEGHWDIVKPRLKEDDICLLQFGHNDQKLPELAARGGYTERLLAYIKEIRRTGARPVLVTPIARNSWADPAHYKDFLAEYAEAVLDLAKAEGTAVIDLHRRSMGKITSEGLEASKKWFFPGDFTHTNDYGAYRLAAWAAKELCGILNIASPAAPEWEPRPPLLPPKPPENCAIKPPAMDPFVPYETERPGDVLTRTEALAIAISALKYFPINVYNDLYSDVIGHETYAGTVQCAAQNGMIPAAWVKDGRLYPASPVTAADFLAVLMPGYAGRKKPGKPAAPPSEVPEYARASAAQALGEGLIERANLTKPITRREAAALCRKLKI